MVLLLQAGDGQGPLVLLVPLLGQGRPRHPPPGDGGGRGPTGAAGEGHLLPDTPDVLLLGAELDGGGVPHVDLHDAACAAGAVGVVRGAGVVPGVGLADLQGESC